MHIGRTGTSIAAIAALTMATTSASADPASSLTGLNGMNAAQAENAIHDLGFKHISSRKTAYGFTNSYWWDKSDRSCVVLEEGGGQVVSVNDAPAEDCGHTKDGSGGAIAAVAGAAILGALLSHKSDHHDDGRHYDDHESERDYDRGFSDGLYNAPYHNYDRSDAYSNGYSAGVAQRAVNLRHHQDRGGYVRTAQYRDLIGERARRSDEMDRRGFRQVDNFTSGNTRYSIRYNRDTRQCVQMTIADGRIYDIRDIGRHPKCR